MSHKSVKLKKMPLGEQDLQALEAPEARRSSWSAWAGWGVAAVVVLAAGPVIVERWYVKGNATPVAALTERGGDDRTVVPSGLGTIYAVSEPPGAGVLMDGRFVGVTPMRFQWGLGTVNLTLKKHGFQDLVAPVVVEGSREVDFRVTLQPEIMPVAATRTAPPATAPETAAVAKVDAPAIPVPPPSPALVPEPPPAIPSPPITLITPPDESESDAPLKLAGVIRHPPEVKIDPEARSGEKSKPDAKARKSPKPEKVAKVAQPVSETDGAIVPVADVRESSRDPELSPLLRQPDAAPSSTLNFAYAIQMSAFLDRDSAIRNAAMWRKRGYDAYVLELWGIKDPTRLWQSVRVGRFNDLVKAKTALEALKRQEKVKGFYVARSDSFTPPDGVAPTQAAKIIPLTGPDLPERGGVQVAASAVPATPVTEGEKVPSEAPQAATAPRETAIPPAPLVAPNPRKSVSKADVKKSDIPPVQESGLKPASTPNPTPNPQPEIVAKSAESPLAETQPSRAEFEAEYPSAPGVSKPGLPVGKMGDILPPPDPMAGDRVVSAPKMVSLQPSLIGVQTARDVLPEATAWSESEFKAQRQAEMKNSGLPPTEQIRNPAPQSAPEPKSLAEKRRAAAQSKEPVRSDPVKVSADQAAWAERSYQHSLEKKEAGDREGEEALLQQVIKADPGHKGAVRRLARLMVETNRGDKALDLLRQAAGGRGDLSLADDDPNLAAFLAALYQRREEHWQAIDLYEALLKKYPNKGLWQMGMAISLEKVDENPEALRAYKKALASGDLNHKLQNFVRKRIEKL
ncbi:MAG: PEGA domain-containing protein [Magnetococcales bacterium]|nr:PEGA domain-containing protein [Magnetococcales bacterium]